MSCSLRGECAQQLAGNQTMLARGRAALPPGFGQVAMAGATVDLQDALKALQDAHRIAAMAPERIDRDDTRFTGPDPRRPCRKSGTGGQTVGGRQIWTPPNGQACLWTAAPPSICQLGVLARKNTRIATAAGISRAGAAEGSQNSFGRAAA
jgi:hypothetical protein